MLLPVLGHGDAGQPGAAFGPVLHDLVQLRRLAGADQLRGLAPGQLHHQCGGKLNTGLQEFRIDAPLEAGARVGGETELLPGQRDPLRREIGAFDQDVGGRLGDARMLAAHDPANIVHAGIVGDRGHAAVERVALAVEREHLLAVARAPCPHGAVELRQIVDVQGPAVAEHQIVGHVDQGADRALAHRFQPALQPGGRGPVLHAPHHTPVERGTTLGIVDDDVHQGADRALTHCLQPALQPGGRRPVLHAADRATVKGGTALGILDRNFDRARVGSGNVRGIHRLQRAEPGCRQIAGNAVHPHRVLPVGRHGDVDHRIVQLGICGKAGPHGRVGGEFNDPVMLVAKLEFADRAHHAAALDAADRRHLQNQVAARHIGARRAEHALQAGARIGRPADHLDGLAPIVIWPGIDGQHLELVRLRMRRGGQHLADDEGGELLCWILHALHFETDPGQSLDDGGEVGIRLQMLLQPGKGELHGSPFPAPACRPGPRIKGFVNFMRRRPRSGWARRARGSRSA